MQCVFDYGVWTVKKRDGRPYADTRLVTYLEKRILELRPRRSQIAIASQAGFPQPNMLANIKSGTSKLPLDRVLGLAEALECDPAFLFRLALQQLGGDTTTIAIERIFRTIVTENEAEWLNEIREASGDSDPHMTSKGRAAIRTIFGR